MRLELGDPDQLAACKAAWVGRVVLVSSLGPGRWLHLLSLFGLILVWKRLGEEWLEANGLKRSIMRPGGHWPHHGSDQCSRSTGAEPESWARNRLSRSQLIELPARAINTVSIEMASITCSAITNLADLEINASDVGP